MPDPAADPRHQRAPKALGGLAALACVACCALPVLIAAGVVGAGAGAVVGWLPALAVVLAVLAAGTWWLGQRRRSCTCAPKTAAREAELREAARGAARADELQALRELGTLEQTEPREGDEAARDELTRRAGSYVQKDVDAWFAHGLAAHLGHYADPAVRAAAADLLPTHLLAHAALLTELAHVAPGAGGRPAGVRGTAHHRRPRGHRRPRRVPRPRPARAELISPSAMSQASPIPSA
ncbi:hypothetical protein [Streptomyces europaeiscabiei]|uniref:hypothetical protein n=1 Tax=Streptomyces europaeiscabiei TaxID=146819 RepID=UPI0038F7F73A